ncbi:hypothetical protein MLD38_030142 [Melastoma candidum]|uniref:Uncharacterized protein n=1 Tax=Melastoma candidum TaxID=119954 RepID=A0ACB9MLD1_9MYRT|nr:hypothetical protein MLD38_030142 [Melastoma candidum]
MNTFGGGGGGDGTRGGGVKGNGGEGGGLDGGGEAGGGEAGGGAGGGEAGGGADGGDAGGGEAGGRDGGGKAGGGKAGKSGGGDRRRGGGGGTSTGGGKIGEGDGDGRLLLDLLLLLGEEAKGLSGEVREVEKGHSPQIPNKYWKKGSHDDEVGEGGWWMGFALDLGGVLLNLGRLLLLLSMPSERRCLPSDGTARSKVSSSNRRSRKKTGFLFGFIVVHAHWISETGLGCSKDPFPIASLSHRPVLIIFGYRASVTVEGKVAVVIECFSELSRVKKAAAEQGAEGVLWYLRHQGYDTKY